MIFTFNHHHRRRRRHVYFHFRKIEIDNFVANGEYLHDGRQVVSCLTDIHDRDFLDRFLLDGSFLVLLDFMCAANSAACFANFSAKLIGFNVMWA